jgi:ubiquinone/menaquinone biosynthesis C-methylase UbiE
MDPDNAIAIEAWNTVLFEKFVRFRHILTRGLDGHSDRCFRRHPPPRGATVLDVGCGFGDTTLALARAVGPSGKATGVDCAESFIRAAEQTAAKAEQPNVAYAVADVQVDELGGPYDRAYARFGTMFFSFPGAALRNVRRALVPGGVFTMIVWRRREDNPWLFEAEQRVREIVPVVAHDQTDQVHCGPGPFSMADADLVSSLFQSAGYRDVTLERCDIEICIGRDIDEAIEFAMALGPAGEIIRLAGDEGERRKSQVARALRDVLDVFRRADGVWAPSSTWFASATNPA